MRNATFIALVVGSAGLASCGATEPTRAAVPERAAPTVSIEAQVDELVRASEPREGHRALDPLVGRWTVTLSDVHGGGRETELARGHATIAWVLDGRFLRWDAELEIAGQPRHTTGYLGFDKRGSVYELLMISNLATGMSVAQGSGDLARSGIRFQLEQADPSSGSILRMQSRLALMTPDHFALDQLADDGRIVRRTHYRRAL